MIVGERDGGGGCVQGGTFINIGNTALTALPTARIY